MSALHQMNARRILLLADTMSPMPAVRFAATLTLVFDDSAMRRPEWWRWTTSLALTLSRLGWRK